MSVSFMGFNEGVLTFEAVSGVAAGKPVVISGNGKVQAVSSGAFCGICLNVREGFAAVQLSGYVKVPFSGSLSVGYQKIGADSSGKVKADATNGREYLVVDVDAAAGTVGIIL